MAKRKKPETPTPPKKAATPAPAPPGPPLPGPFVGIPDLPATHDAMFKVLAKAHAAALLAHLPERYRELLDLDRPPEPMDGNLFDESLRLSQPDFLLKVYLKRRIRTPDGEEQDFAVVLFEHKSWVDPGTVLQLEGYRLKVMKFYARAHRTEWKGRRNRPRPPLPLFIPIVFYHGRRKWNAPTSLRQMFRHQDAAGPGMHGLEYTLRDIGDIPLDELADEPEPRAVLTAMRFATRGRQGEPHLAGIFRALAGDRVLRRQVEYYMLTKSGISSAAIIAAEEAANRETEEERIMPSLIDTLRNEGRVEGMLKGKADVVMNLLRHRFKRLSKQDKSRVAKASAEELDLWAERLLTADSREDVFAPQSSH